jgi:hypothetical protein
MKIKKILGVVLIANLTMTACSKNTGTAQSSAASSGASSEGTQLREVNIVLDATKKTAQNAAEAYDLGIVSAGQVKTSRYYISNTTGSNINLTFTDLMAQVAQNSRFSVANNTCSSILKNLKTCYFDISLNYVSTMSAEDYQVPLITTIVSGASNPEFGKILFSGLKATDVTSQTALLSVLRPDRLSESFIVPANQSVTKRFYLSNISTKAITTPSINAPLNGVISANTCATTSTLKIAGTCYFELTYTSDLSAGKENYNSAITFSSSDATLDPKGLEIAVSVTNQPVVVPAVSVSFSQVGTITNLTTDTESTRIYVSNTGTSDLDTSSVVIPEQYVVSGTSCTSSLKSGKSCFYDLKIDTTKTTNMVSLVATVSIGSSSTQVKSGVTTNTATTCAAGFSSVNNVCISSFAPNVTKVTLDGGKIKLEGSGLAGSTSLKIKKANGTIINVGSVVASASSLTAELTQMVSFAMNEAFQVIIGDANAQSVPVDLVFNVADRSISTQKLSGALGGVGVSTGQTLTWNGSDWVASTPASSQMFISTYDASTGLPAIEANPVVGDYYIVSKEGSQNLNGTGAVAYKVGDQVMYDGSQWKRIASSSLIKSVFGRVGEVVAQSGDYSWSMLEKLNGKIKGSKLGEIEDVDLSIAPQANQFLGYDDASHTWIPKTVIIPSQQVLNSNISDSEISMEKVNGLVAVLAGKEPAIIAGTTDQYIRGDKTLSTFATDAKAALVTDLATKQDTIQSGLFTQYYRGDKTFADLASDVRSAALTGLSTTTNTVINQVDTVISAFGKIQAQISALLTQVGTKADLTNVAQSITASNITVTTINGQAYPGFTNYLTAATAASTYATQASLSSYLKTTDAASTYATLAGLSSYLTTATAASTYATQASLSNYITTASLPNIQYANSSTLQVKGASSGSYAFPSNDSKAALDIAGSAITRTYTLASTASGIDLSKSNSISVTAQSAAAVALNNIQDGGAYTIAFTDSSTLTPSFTATGAESGAPTLTLKVYPTLTARTSGKHLVMSATRIGSYVYISWQEF